MTTHAYDVQVTWTGNRGAGTRHYGAYARDHEIAVAQKPVILASSDSCFRGDPCRHNPEDLFVASISSCHMLWYLHLCSEAKIVVTSYVDRASGSMVEAADGSGKFTEVTLRPEVTIQAGGDAALAASLHERAHHMCFIANSVSIPVACEPTIACAAA